MIKWNESRKLSRSRLLPQMLIDLSRSLPPQRELACVARIASELLLADDVAVAQRMRQCSRCGQVVRVRVGWPRGRCCGMRRDEVAVAVAKGKGQRRCKGDVHLSGKILELPDCFEIAGNHVHSPSLPLRLKAPGKMKLELELSAPASSSIYLVNPPSNPTSILSR